LEALRWTVIVRDGRACDFLGDGRPTERFTVGAAEVGGTPHPDVRSGLAVWWVVAGAAVALAGLGTYVVRRVR